MINDDSEKFLVLVDQLLDNCRARGVVMMPHELLRSPSTQAKYWKQGRTADVIKAGIRQLRDADAPFLAQCLVDAEQASGEVITNALPGLSWHQWGLAIDCFWIYENKRIWNADFLDAKGKNGYDVYAQEAVKLNLDAGFYWKSFVDAGHVQYSKQASPESIYSLNEINGFMESFYRE